MIEEEAYVTEVADGSVWVEKASRSACSGCAQSCPSAIAGELFGKKSLSLQIFSNLPLSRGDKVLIGVSEDVLALGSILVYLLPLLCLIGGAMLGKFLQDSDAASATGGILGLAFCYAGLKFLRVFDRADYRPVILRKIN